MTAPLHRLTGTALPAFDWRTAPCPNEGCDDGKVTMIEPNGFFTIACDECEGRAVVDASCAECACIKPLNDDGLCEPCADSLIMPQAEWVAKHLAPPFVEVEHGTDPKTGNPRIAA